MDAGTVAVYERRAHEWIERRGEASDGLGRRFRERVGSGLVADLGCGAGRYLAEIGQPLVGVDVTAAMLALARRSGYPLVRADLEASRLPKGPSPARSPGTRTCTCPRPASVTPCPMCAEHYGPVGCSWSR